MFSLLVAIGNSIAVTPRMPSTLKILEPTTLPMATSELPETAPLRLTSSSGNEVPNPTTTAPITKSEILRRRAIATEPSTKRSAPKAIARSDYYEN